MLQESIEKCFEEAIAQQELAEEADNEAKRCLEEVEKSKPSLEFAKCVVKLALLCSTALVLTCCSPTENSTMLPMPPDEPVEYLLPANNIPDDVRKSFSPWVAGFIGLSPKDATERLHERWAPIKRTSLVKLREVLSEFVVRSVVDYGEGGLIYAVRPNTDEDEDYVGNSYFLPAQTSSDEITDNLSAIGLNDVEGLTEFLTYFGGLREDTTTAGHFVPADDEWRTFTDSWDGTIEGFDEWKNSLMFYNARDGCQLLLRSDGKTAWWVMPERLVGEYANSFDEFVEKFAEHRKIAYPFDPYGPSD